MTGKDKVAVRTALERFKREIEAAQKHLAGTAWAPINEAIKDLYRNDSILVEHPDVVDALSSIFSWVCGSAITDVNNAISVIETAVEELCPTAKERKGYWKC